MNATITRQTDSQIKNSVLNELKWDLIVDETEIGVQVSDGVVTMAGEISAYPRKLAAIKAAHRVPGVLDVVDDMTVRLPLAWQRSDHDVAASVREALRQDVLVPDEHIETTVSNGMVTLAGRVETWRQAYDAERTVQRIRGVRDVRNELSIAARPVDPLQIRRRIEEALERDAQREARRLGVTVQDGVVTLSGPARSWAERTRVERIAAMTPGVRRVVDHMTIDAIT